MKKKKISPMHLVVLVATLILTMLAYEALRFLPFLSERTTVLTTLFILYLINWALHKLLIKKK